MAAMQRGRSTELELELLAVQLGEGLRAARRNVEGKESLDMLADGRRERIDMINIPAPADCQPDSPSDRRCRRRQFVMAFWRLEVVSG